MFSADAAARYIDEAHRTRARYQNLPEAIAPQTVVDAYAAQAALCGLWGARLGPVAGLKIATTTRIMQQLMGTLWARSPGSPTRPPSAAGR